MAIALLSVCCAISTRPTQAQSNSAPLPESFSEPIPIPEPIPDPATWPQPIPKPPSHPHPDSTDSTDNKERPLSRAAIAIQLAEIAFGYAQAQSSDKAIALLEIAETYANEEGCFESAPLLKIGVAYQMAGEIEKSEALLESAVKSATVRTEENCALSATSPTESFHNRAVEYAKAGYLDLGLQLTYRIDGFFRTLALIEIAVAFAEAGRQSEAEQIINQAIAEEQQTVVRYASEAEDALPLTAIANRFFSIAADQLIEAGQPELAKSFINQIERPSEPAEVEQNWGFASRFQQELFATERLIKIEHPQQALQRLDAAVQYLEAPPEDPSSWLEAAAIYSQLDSPKANKLFAIFESSLSQVSADKKVDTQTALVESYASIGEIERALAIFKKMDSGDRSRDAKWAIAKGYARTERALEAYAFVEANINELTRSQLMRFHLQEGQYAAAAEIAQQSDMLGFLPEVAEAYCEAGQPEAVILLLSNETQPIRTQSIETRPTATMPLTDFERDFMYRCAAEAFAEKGAFSQALEAANKIGSTGSHARTLSKIGTRQAQTGSAEESAKTLNQALGLLVQATGESFSTD